eukprot:TRINITY_DN1337_c0_g1_i1.p1 TRINITY_DN1337_c0_g1~~TRINITY_DN1337_c0_g1_i1.p1  ORF type:complete len:108 (-),score=22.80 TRINITY_DN1337_c0_g1_i1:167-490(-)
MSKKNFNLYRKSTIGTKLSESLDELIRAGKMDNSVAYDILEEFDRVINHYLATQVKDKYTLKGDLDYYRQCDNVWTLIVKDAIIRQGDTELHASRVRIVACDTKSKE